MAIEKVDLKPIGRAMQRAKDDLNELARQAPPQASKEIRARIRKLEILIRALPRVCKAPLIKKPPVFTTAFCAKINPAFTITLRRPDRLNVRNRKKK